MCKNELDFQPGTEVSVAHLYALHSHMLEFLYLKICMTTGRAARSTAHCVQAL